MTMKRQTETLSQARSTLTKPMQRVRRAKAKAAKLATSPASHQLRNPSGPLKKSTMKEMKKFKEDYLQTVDHWEESSRLIQNGLQKAIEKDHERKSEVFRKISILIVASVWGTLSYVLLQRFGFATVISFDSFLVVIGALR